MAKIVIVGERDPKERSGTDKTKQTKTTNPQNKHKNQATDLSLSSVSRRVSEHPYGRKFEIPVQRSHRSAACPMGERTIGAKQMCQPSSIQENIRLPLRPHQITRSHPKHSPLQIDGTSGGSGPSGRNGLTRRVSSQSRMSQSWSVISLARAVLYFPWPPQVHHNEMQPTYLVIVGDTVL